MKRRIRPKPAVRNSVIADRCDVFAIASLDEATSAAVATAKREAKRRAKKNT